jgi:hypothetical protein
VDRPFAVVRGDSGVSTRFRWRLVVPAVVSMAGSLSQSVRVVGSGFDGSAEVEALADAAADALEVFPRGLVFDPFGDDA